MYTDCCIKCLHGFYNFSRDFRCLALVKNKQGKSHDVKTKVPVNYRLAWKNSVIHTQQGLIFIQFSSVTTRRVLLIIISLLNSTLFGLRFGTMIYYSLKNPSLVLTPHCHEYTYMCAIHAHRCKQSKHTL